MLEQLIEKLLENGLYLNGEQPDTVLEQGITVNDIEVNNDNRVTISYEDFM